MHAFLLLLDGWSAGLVVLDSDWHSLRQQSLTWYSLFADANADADPLDAAEANALDDALDVADVLAHAPDDVDAFAIADAEKSDFSALTADFFPPKVGLFDRRNFPVENHATSTWLRPRGAQKMTKVGLLGANAGLMTTLMLDDDVPRPGNFVMGRK